MTFHVPEHLRFTNANHEMGTASLAGNYGVFLIPWGKVHMICIASDGAPEKDNYPWEHVSVHIEDGKGKQILPNWNEMCYIKDMFWDEDDVVMQLHPRKSDYINIHPKVLHLWRPVTQIIPTPPLEMV